jgi:hypothetical protein
MKKIIKYLSPYREEIMNKNKIYFRELLITNNYQVKKRAGTIWLNNKYFSYATKKYYNSLEEAKSKTDNLLLKRNYVFLTEDQYNKLKVLL